jgi:transposase-like protein
MRNTRTSNKTSASRYTEAERESLLLAYWESGVAQEVFAREAGIGLSTLQTWLRRARRQARSERRAVKGGAASPAVSLLEVDLGGLPTARPAAGVPYELKLRNGTRLRLSPGFESADVRRLLELLQEVR